MNILARPFNLRPMQFQIIFNPTSAAFGKITGKTGDVRNMQLSLRLYF